MDNRVCENCDNSYNRKLDFCPKCGMYNAELEEIAPAKDDATNRDDGLVENNNTLSQESIEYVVRKMADNITTIKKIMVFFVWLWAIGVLLCVTLLLIGL